MKWYELVSTWFGLGKSSFMPGTIGTFGAMPFLYFAYYSSSSDYEVKMTLLFFVVLLSIIGYFAIRKYHEAFRIIDAQSIVVDEVIGQLVTLGLAYDWIVSALKKFSIVPVDTGDNMAIFYIFMAAFIPFRFFDITKPFYISLIDRYWKNAVGVILDDVLAGFVAAAVLYILR